MRDREAITRIGREAFPYIKNPEQFFAERLQRGWIFVAEAGEVVGFVDVSIEGERAVIEGIAVDKAWRGKGIGRTLLSAALRFLRAIGVREVVLYTRDSNEAARRLYKGAGFTSEEVVREDIRRWRLVFKRSGAKD